MLVPDTLSDLLVAVVTGDVDHARKVISSVDGLDEETGAELVRALESSSTAAGRTRALGDALRLRGAPQDQVNECYRAAFFSGTSWQELAEDRLFAYSMANHSGAVLDKWPHYFPVYTRHLERFRGQPVRVLEIGVYRGGGLDMWRWFFGPEAHLVGVDIDEVAKDVVGQRHTVVLGDQSDPEFLAALVRDHGPFDVVIDDGGHTMQQQIVSAETLFPLVADGGVYLVEDCHTSYWPSYEGGLKRPGTFMEWVKDRLDDVHGYHVHDGEDHVSPVWTNAVGGLHVYDSVVVLDRAERFAPFAQQTGSVGYLYKSRLTSAVQAEIIATRDAAVLQRDAARAELVQAQTGAQADARLARAELAALRPQLAATEDELERTRRQLLESWDQVKRMRHTISWRVTAPLRRLRGGRG